jgi:NADH-quinone oxidoreductase subunit J
MEIQGKLIIIGGAVIFTKYLIPFEVASLMLLIAMIAGIILAGKKMDISLTTTVEDDKRAESFDEFRIGQKTEEGK